MSNLSLERLLFDPTDPTSQPLVGSYILSASGNVIDDTSGALDVYLSNASIAITATDLDIRDLLYTQDSVSAYITNGTYSLDIDSNGYLTVNINGEVDIRDLVYTSDSVTAHQGGSWAVTTDVLPNIEPLSAAISVTDTAVALPTTPLTSRKRLQIQNVGSDPIEIGKSTITYGTGLVIPKGATETIEAGPSATFYGIAASGKTVAVRILEW